jgi:putative ABC transport system permease protein
MIGTLQQELRYGLRMLLKQQNLWQDLRFGARMLLKNPGFTAVAVLTLALGIGANTAIFGVINAVLLRPLPFPAEERLVRVYMMRDQRPPYISLPVRSFLEVHQQGQFFESITGQRLVELTLTTPEGPEQVRSISVSDGWLETLGVKPIVGRAFSDEEERAGSESGVALISYGFWERRFGSETGVLGKTLTLNDRTFTIIGVMPRGFSFPYDGELWLPMNPQSNPAGVWALNVLARLKPAVTLEQAKAELNVMSQRLAQELPDIHRGTNLIAIPIRQVLLGDEGKGDEGRTVLALFAAVGLVLLIACANLANLLMTRALARQREMTIRAALGATRWRQVRQLLTESVLLALIGATLGLLVAMWGSGFLTRLMPKDLHQVVPEITVDWSALAFTLAISFLATVIFGLVPALRTSRIELHSFMKEGGQSGSAPASRRLAHAFVVAEIALALALLAGAGLMIRNLQRLYQTDLGYRHEHLINLKVTLNEARYGTAQPRVNLVRQIEEQLKAVPGVEAAGATCIFPLRGGNFLASLEIDGRPRELNQRFIVNHRLVSPGFLQTLGMPLLQGRLLTAADNEQSQPVVIVSRALARRYFPDQDPLGQRVRNLRDGAASPWLKIVGVVGDVKEFYDVSETWYLPYAQHAGSNLAAQVIFSVRATTGLASIASGLRRAVWASDPTLPVYDLATVEEKFAETLSQQQMGTVLLGVFAGVGLLMAALGIFGVMSYAVSQRTHEIGIRLALGAQPREILSLILKQGVNLVLLGLAFGLSGALIITRLLASLLLEVGVTDPVILISVAALMAAVALLACYVPARRAAKLDPMLALRYQ